MRLIAAAPVAMAVLRADGTTGFVNPKFSELLGYTQEELPLADDWWHALFPDPDYRSQVRARWAAQVAEWAQGSTRPFEARIQRKDGVFRYIETRAGTVGGDMLLCLMDVTERREDEEALREWVSAVNAVNDPIFLHDAEGRILRANPAFARRANVTLPEVIGRPYWEVLPKGKGLLSSCGEAIRTGKAVETEDITTETGEVLHSRAHAILSENGQFLYSIHVLEDVTEQAMMQRALAASEKKHRELVENLHEGIWVVDKEGNTTFVNQLMAQMLGYGVEEMMGRSIYSFVDGAMAQTLRDKEERRRQGVKEQYEIELLRKDGTRISVTVAESPLYGDDGGYAGRVACILDTTERKLAETALKDAKEYAERLIETANALVVQVDTAGKIEVFNPAAEAVTGYRFAEAKGMNLFESIVPRERYPKVWDAFRRLISDETPKRFENPILTRSGEERYVVWQNSAVREDGRITGILAFGIDITERRKAEEALLEEKLFSDAIIQSAPGAFFVLDEQGNLLRWNRYVNLVTGLDDKQLLGAPAIVFIAQEDRELAAAKIMMGLATGYSQVELRVVDRERGVRYFVKTARRFEVNGVPYLVGYSVDITERKQVEEALRSEKAFFDSLIDSVPGAFFVIDSEGTYYRWNSYLNRLTGLSDEVLRRTPLLLTIHEEDRPLAASVVKEAFISGYGESELRLLTRDRGVRVFFVNARRFHVDHTAFLVCVGVDTTERLAMERSLEREARTDSLTGAIGRGYFLTLAEQELARSQRYRRPLSVWMFDLDHFKMINDTWGHRVGDLMLQSVVRASRRILRDLDILGRVGGEEFAVLLPETGAEEAVLAAERLRQAIAAAGVAVAEGPVVHCTVSIGVATLSGEEEEIGVLLERADRALYDAKQSGRNRICVARPPEEV